MLKGYAGKMAFVDLGSGSIKEEPLDEETGRHFIGGFGLGARILYERMKANVDPLGPDSLLGFVTGPLTGTTVPSTSRYTVVAKSPLTNTWNDANSGGYFGPELKAAGYDAVFISGVAPKPVYLLLKDGKAELRDATHLWGKDTVETQQILRRELGDSAIRVACIGPSGESQSLIAAVINDEGRAAARAGLGAVMGAKRLKAVVARGTSKVPVADSTRLSVLRKDYLKALSGITAGAIPSLKSVGTSIWLSLSVKSGVAPIKNWSLVGEEAFPDHDKIGAEAVAKLKVKKYACRGCPIACGGTVRVDEGPFAIGEGYKPEYETLVQFGTLCLNSNLESIIKANDICNRYGIDTLSAGGAIAFAMECYEHGIISKDETDGIELTWGNAAALIAMLGKIAKREGFGAVLADGVKKAAEQIGRGSEEFAMHVGGQELPAHDPRRAPCYGVGYIADPTPGRHHAGVLGALLEVMRAGPYPELQPPLIKGPHDYQQRGLAYFTGSNYWQVFSCSGMCWFVMLTGMFPLVEFMSAVTGCDYTVPEFITTGRRIRTLCQAFNIREGVPVTKFSLPDRVNMPASMGPFAKRVVDFDGLRIQYYRAIGWDVDTGKPLESTLQELGLTEIVGVLPES